jgi:hypothetical protein
MSGFTRQGRRPARSRAEIAAVVSTFLSAEDLGLVQRTQDPFGLDHDCINPGGHDAIASCGEIVCVHCAKVFWR